jgi:hypothetical protein
VCSPHSVCRRMQRGSTYAPARGWEIDDHGGDEDRRICDASCRAGIITVVDDAAGPHAVCRTFSFATHLMCVCRFSGRMSYHFSIWGVLLYVYPREMPWVLREGFLAIPTPSLVQSDCLKLPVTDIRPSSSRRHGSRISIRPSNICK